MITKLKNQDKLLIRSREVSNEIRFKVGDRVEWGGAQGRVFDVSLENLDYPVRVIFDKDSTVFWFTGDGRCKTIHTVPSLTLVEGPKKKVKKYMVVYKRHYSNFSISFQVSDYFYYDQKDFEDKHPHLEFIQLLKESEIELEE